MNDNDLIIDYDAFTVEAMRGLVREVLYDISERGLPDKHHLYITYITNFKNVVISDALREKYPDKMTIVIENSYWDLNVNKESFTLKLSFDGIKNTLTIPFNSLVSFSDPFADFHLKFPRVNYNEKKIKENKIYNKENIINMNDFKKDK
tara:strand:- start:932 stop:1378 length:447 start_codon:yes stop_codon:yes gene_type:complete